MLTVTTGAVMQERDVTTSSPTTETQKRDVPDPVLPTSLPLILTVDELAVLLRVNRKTVYAAIREGAIPGVVRVGGTIRISRDVVLAWTAGEGRVSSSSWRNP